MSIDIETCTSNLRRNGFDVFRATDKDDAGRVFFDEIIPIVEFGTVSWGDSMTMHSTGVLNKLRTMPNVNIVVTFDPSYNYEQKISKRREALGVDLFLTGTNALTEKGQLVNLDMIGNRVGGLTFGPRNVVVFVSVNKIFTSLDAAMEHVKQITAPKNSQRHTNMQTPCQKVGKCVDCYSPDRICNVWTIHERCYPKGRIKIILIDEPLGLY